MTVQELIRALQAVENQSLPVEIHDPYGEADDEWIPEDSEPVRVIPGRCVAIQMGARLMESEDTHP